MCSSLRWLHISHFTAQHHTNLHLHFSSTNRIRVWWPRPQHIILQPSIPGDVLLHSRPFVPKMPNLESEREWKSGDKKNNNAINNCGSILSRKWSNCFAHSNREWWRKPNKCGAWNNTLTHRYDHNNRVNLPNKLNQIWLVFYTVGHVDVISIHGRHVRSAKIVIFNGRHIILWSSSNTNLF